GAGRFHDGGDRCARRRLQHRNDARLGDLDDASRRLLDGSGSPEKAGQNAVNLVRPIADVRPGTSFSREWNGHMQRVTVLADGFAWNGKIYPSLSKVAFAITGTRWNGPRFFGLRDKPSKGSVACRPDRSVAARSILVSRRTKGWSRTLIPSTLNTMLRRPISAAKPMPAGLCCALNMTTAASQAATPTGQPCSDSWTTC